MGLSASPARLLDLTARQHELEYKAQNLEAQKLQMANESDKVYQDYQDALNKQKIQIKGISTDGSASYTDAAFIDVAKAGYSIKVKNIKTGTWSQVNFTTAKADTSLSTTDSNAIATALYGSGSFTDSKTTFSNLVEEGYIVFVKANTDSDGNVLTDAEGKTIYSET